MTQTIKKERFCPKCGVGNRAGLRFCLACGANMDPPPPPPPPPPPAPTPAAPPAASQMRAPPPDVPTEEEIRELLRQPEPRPHIKPLPKPVDYEKQRFSPELPTHRLPRPAIVIGMAALALAAIGWGIYKVMPSAPDASIAAQPAQPIKPLQMAPLPITSSTAPEPSPPVAEAATPEPQASQVAEEPSEAAPAPAQPPTEEPAKATPPPRAKKPKVKAKPAPSPEPAPAPPLPEAPISTPEPPPPRAPTIPERIAQCKTQGFFAQQRCVWAICEGRWGQDGCPVVTAPREP